MSRTKRDEIRHPSSIPNSASSRSGSNKRQKNLFIRARVSPEEKEEIRQRAEKAGLTEGAFVRAQCLDAPPKTRSIRRPSLERTKLARMVGLLGNATGNLNQISKNLNQGKVPASQDVDQALLEIRRAASEIMEVIGRRLNGG